MQYLRRLLSFDESIRGAFTLGALLLFALFVAALGAFNIYTQLNSAASVERALARSQQQLYEAMRVQLDEETGLRGYLATKQEDYLDPYVTAADQFDSALAELRRDSVTLDIQGFDDSLKDMVATHRAWEDRVARQLLYHPNPNLTRFRESEGKVLTDRLRADASRVNQLLDVRFTRAQKDLKQRINATLAAGIFAIALVAAIGVTSLAFRARLLKQLDRERGIIETLQRAFQLDWNTLPRFRIGTAYVSATRGARVGGDLFDVRRLDEGRGLLLVADVSGKGIEAAVNTAFVKYSIRTLALTYDDPAQILDAFNRLFAETINDPTLFVVVFVGIMDLATGRLMYASAGHSGAYLRRGRTVSQLEITGPIVGMDRNSQYVSASVQLLPRDLLLMATDGLTEARDRSGRVLDDDGAMKLLETAPSDPQACADELARVVRRRSGGRIADDLALLAVAVDADEAGGSTSTVGAT